MTKQEYTRLKGCKLNKYIRAIESLGYSLDRQSGSHMIFKADNMPILSLPCHDNISPGVWRNLGRLLSLV